MTWLILSFNLAPPVNAGSVDGEAAVVEPVATVNYDKLPYFTRMAVWRSAATTTWLYGPKQLRGLG